jgi:hypothetical protein
MVFLKQATLGKNSNVDYICKKGDHIMVGDPLISFDTSYEDDSVNDLLAKLSDDAKASIMNNARNIIPSKYSGVIEDIKIYSTVEPEEMSPTLKKIVTSYWRSINRKKEFIQKYDNSEGICKGGILFTETTKRIEPDGFGIVKGQKLEDGVLIEFYIKHSENLEIGSKIANFTKVR